MRGFKYSTNRMGKRLGNGRFARPTFRDVFGVDPNDERRTCLTCGHEWFPVLITGTCPACGTERAAVERAASEQKGANDGGRPA